MPNNPVMARLMEAAATLRDLRISRKECISCGRSLAHRTDYKPGEECQRCEEDMPLPPMDDMDEDDAMGDEAGTTGPLVGVCQHADCERKPGSDVCLECALDDEGAMAVLINRVRAA